MFEQRDVAALAPQASVSFEFEFEFEFESMFMTFFVMRSRQMPVCSCDVCGQCMFLNSCVDLVRCYGLMLQSSTAYCIII